VSKELTFDYTTLVDTHAVNYYLKSLIVDTNIKTVVLKDTNIKLSRKRLIINLFILYILNKYNLPVRKKYLLLGSIDNGPLYKVYDNIYNALINQFKTKSDQDFYNTIYLNIRWDFWYGINWLNNFAITYTKEYISSLDIENVSAISHHPKVKKIKEQPIDNHGVTYIEKENEKIRKQLLNTIKSIDKLEDGSTNQLKTILDLKLANEGQIGHMIHRIGYRTDVDDSTIPKLINGNYLDGIDNSTDFILEALADKKSRLYNKLLMPHCQYSNRKIQLMMYNIKNIYPIECGTKKMVTFLVDDRNYKGIVGKYIDIKSIEPKVWKRLEKDNIKLIASKRYPNLHQLTKQTAPYFIDSMIKMKSPLTCLYSDGVCSLCGGKLLEYYIQREFNLGHTSSTEFYQRTSQKVLSSKHFQITTSKEYQLNEKLKSIFIKRTKKIYLRPDVSTKGLEIGFNIHDARYLLNISKECNISENEIFENNFGKYRTICIRKLKDDKVTYMSEVIPLEYLRYYPKLTKEFILYLLQHHNFKPEQDILWIPLEKFDKSKPIFNTTIINYSIKIFYNKIDSFIKYQINKYNNVSLVLQDFSDIIYERSNINILYLEILLKSFLVKNRLDLSNVACDEDSDTAIFGKLDHILKQRHIGAALAYQEHHRFLRNPLFYLVPKNLSEFDIFLNYIFN